MAKSLDPEDFIKRAKAIEIQKRKRSIIVTSFVVVLTISYLLYTILTVKKSNEDKAKVEKVNNTLLNRITKEDSAKRTIYSYFKYQNQTDTLNVLNLLSDTVLRYYLIDKPIAKSMLKANKNFEINQKGKYIVDSNFTVSNFHDTLYSLIKTPAYADNKTYEIMHEIKMNLSYKIIYVRAYELNSEKVKAKFGVK